MKFRKMHLGSFLAREAKKHKNSDESGQALLFVVVALTVALAVGISTSLRTLSSLSRVSTTDTSSRVLAAAEGGLEEFLAHATTQLQADVATCTSLEDTAENPIPESCIVDFSTDDAENIQARALVKVEEFVGDPEDEGSYRTVVRATSPMPINLSGYSGNSLTLCWSSVDGDSDETPVFFVIYTGDSSGDMDWSKGVICPAGNDYANCAISDDLWVDSDDERFHAVTLPSCTGRGLANGHQFSFGSGNFGEIGGLVVYPLRTDINIALIPDGDAFDSILGYNITSKGELVQENEVTATTTVTAQRGYPHVTIPFLFSIFALDGISAN